MSIKRVLITGASGFIGSNLMRHIPDDWRVTTLKHDNYFAGADDDLGHGIPDHFDIGIHLAGNSDPAESGRSPQYDLSSHAEYLLKIFAFFRFDRFVYLSSGAVYDGCLGSVGPNTPLSPTLPYAIAKLAAEGYVKYFHKSGLIGDYSIIRFFGAYGPGEPERKIYTQLVRRFGIERRPEFTIRGNGQNLIDAMYVDDAVRTIIAIAQNEDGRKSWTQDLASGQPMSISQLVESAGAKFGLNPIIQYRGTVPEHILFWSDSPKAPDNLTPLGDGLEILRKSLVR